MEASEPMDKFSGLGRLSLAISLQSFRDSTVIRDKREHATERVRSKASKQTEVGSQRKCSSTSETTPCLATQVTNRYGP
jgi:hypothetical protein